jgi:hypothetical protein
MGRDGLVLGLDTGKELEDRTAAADLIAEQRSTEDILPSNCVGGAPPGPLS